MTRPPAFTILTDRDGGTVTVELQGELDLATAPRLEAEFADIAGEQGLARVVVDLRNLSFLDSTGLEAIARLDTRSRRAGFEVAILRGPRAVERLFAVMQLDKRLQIVDDPAEVSA